MKKAVFEEIRVADFSWGAAGPLVGKILGEYGAEVIHIESSTHPDGIRTSYPFKDNKPGLDNALFPDLYNNDKYGMTLNLSHPKGFEIAKKIIAWADVMIESFTPGVMARWGLGYEDVQKLNPSVIMVSTCNQGQTGPHAKHPGWGIQFTSFAGFVHVTGWPDRGPVMLPVAYTDMIAPRFIVAAVAAALAYRQRTGKGQYLDVSQYETAVQFLSPAILDYVINGRIAIRMGNRAASAAPHGVYPCKGDDRWCAISVSNDTEWESFCKAVGNPAWTKGPRFATLSERKENEAELDRLVGQWTINFTPQQVMAMMQESGVPAGVVATAEDVCNDPQLKHRHHFQELDHSVLGRHNYEATSFKLSKTPGSPSRAAPCLGEHTYYVCTKILSISEEEFVQLLSEGVFE